MRPFLFAGGIENTFINTPHPDTGKRLDEYELTGHYNRVISDLDLVSSVGINALRWGIPWYRVNPAPGRFEWDFADGAIDHMVGHLNVKPIVDLLHYGTPDWIENSFLDERFLEAYVHYLGAFCERYRGTVNMATPVNEPWTTAEFCGRRGEWPPYRSDDAGFAQIMVVLAGAAVKASQLLRDHGMEAVHVEVAGDHVALDDDAGPFADHRNGEFRLYWDLVTGRIDESHRLFPWLLENGVEERQLVGLSKTPTSLDVVGINFYPQWCVQLVTAEPNGPPRMVPLQSDADTLARLLRGYAADYGAPVMVTETSVYGPAWRKQQWLQESVDVCLKLRDEEVPVSGYTWFPMIDMIDWEYRNRTGPAEDYVIDLGMWDIDRRARSVADTYRILIEQTRKGNTNAVRR